MPPLKPAKIAVDPTYTLAFIATISGTAHTYVYTQSGGSAGGDLIDLVGVTATSLMTIGTTAGGLFIA